MRLANLLKNKKITVTEVPNGGVVLRKQWEDHFVNHLSEKEKSDIHLWDKEDGCCGFLWHVFSYEKRECLKEQEAEKAFHDEQNSSCYVFWQYSMMHYF